VVIVKGVSTLFLESVGKIRETVLIPQNAVKTLQMAVVSFGGN